MQKLFLLTKRRYKNAKFFYKTKDKTQRATPTGAARHFHSSAISADSV